jgi:hypothetical protein
VSRDCYHNVQVRAAERERLIELLRRDPALSRFEYYVGPQEGPWLGVFPRLIIRGPKVAKGVSKHLRTHAFAFRTFGEGALLYEYYRNGERHDRYSSAPDVVRKGTDMDSELADIVEQWEEGILSAAEYRERVDGYLGSYDSKLQSVKAQAEGALRTLEPKEAARVASDVVYEVFRGAQADRAILEVLERRFQDPGERRMALEAFEALTAEGPAGGDPRAYQELLDSQPELDAVRAILRRADREGAAILRSLGAKLEMGRVELSYQHIEDSKEGFTKVSPEEG